MIIDLRSDTVTRPVDGMYEAMRTAQVGDDVYGEDVTVNQLQERVAALLNKEAALFVPSGTMANQICLNILGRPGEEVICERSAHVFNYESGAMARLSGLQPHVLDGAGGIMDVEQISAAIRPHDAHYPPTRIIALENTLNRAGGRIFPLLNIRHISTLARRKQLMMHLDGARLWNAAIASGVSLAEFAEPFDTVSVCFSKGLGAPVGSIVAASRELIARAHRVRKQLGGGMRQAGILAAACLYALDHHFDRLHEDHANAKLLADQLANVPGIILDPEQVDTNIVMFRLSWQPDPAEICAALKAEGVLISSMGQGLLRATTHLDVDEAAITRAGEIMSRTIRRLVPA